MTQNQIKQLVATHFDYAPMDQGQFIFGEWFTPKHKDSLHYLLEEIGISDHHISHVEAEIYQRRIEKLEKEIERLTDKAA